MERWRRINGTDFVAWWLTYPVSACTFPNNCGTYGLLETPGATSPKWEGLQAFINGQIGTLPFTSADLPVTPATPTCTPSCQWGLCQWDGSCQCFEGYTGATCSDVTAKRTDCAADIGGVNLDGLSDWGPEVSYVDIGKRSRDWVSQDFIACV